MGRKEYEYNNHHWCPDSRGGRTNDLNCEMIRKTYHQAIHTVFSNDIFPEQIERLINMTSKTLKPEIVAELLEHLKSLWDINNPVDWYKEWCLWIKNKKIYLTKWLEEWD